MEGWKGDMGNMRCMCAEYNLDGRIGIDPRGGLRKEPRTVGVDRRGERNLNPRPHSDLRESLIRSANTFALSQQAYVMGYVKLVVTTVKYMPQVVTNYRRKSTTGWSIQQIILDAIGGVFSIAQLLIDCSLQGDWSGIAGNSTKLALGYISLLFDSVSKHHRSKLWSLS